MVLPLLRPGPPHETISTTLSGAPPVMRVFWAQIKNPSQAAENMASKGKKKGLLSPLYERTLDIIHKCMESKVAVMDDVRAKKARYDACYSVNA